MQRNLRLETDFNVTVGRLVMHYKEFLSEEPKSTQEIGLAVLLHTSVRALSLQSVLSCGTKNGLSAAAACEHFEKRYVSSSLRQKWRRGFCRAFQFVRFAPPHCDGRWTSARHRRV